MLTLGSKICKDKFMQAAGRMRKLDTQNLIYAGTLEVTNKIMKFSNKESHEIGPKQILEWVLDNTIKFLENGLLEWARQGMIFDMVKNDKSKCILEDKTDLAFL